MMKRRILFVFFLSIIVVSCARVNPPAQEGDSALSYGKALMNEGKMTLAIVEFKKALDFFNEAGYTYSAFSVYPYIARAYYLSDSRDEAIATYIVALEYAKEHPEGVGSNNVADAMRELAGLLVEAKRIEEARYVLMDAAEFYKKAENFEKLNEVMEELNGL